MPFFGTISKVYGVLLKAGVFLTGVVPIFEKSPLASSTCTQKPYGLDWKVIVVRFGVREGPGVTAAATWRLTDCALLDEAVEAAAVGVPQGAPDGSVFGT